MSDFLESFFCKHEYFQHKPQLGINHVFSIYLSEGWTRRGNRLENADLWKVTKLALSALAKANIEVEFRHVSAHVGIHGNERADRLAKAAAKRAHAAAARTDEQREDQALDTLAEFIVLVTARR